MRLQGNENQVWVAETSHDWLEARLTRWFGECLKGRRVKLKGFTQVPKGENYNQFQPSLSINLDSTWGGVIVTNHYVLMKIKQLMSGTKESTTTYE